MAWSEWRAPRTARQIEQQEIVMKGTGTAWRSKQPVRSISTSFGTFEREESNAVVFEDFGFSPGIVAGIELKLVTTRQARIQDKTVQLEFDGEPISENRADLSAGDAHVYGSDHDRWGITSDRVIPIESPLFGVMIDLQPHTSIPCADLVYIRSVLLRVYYPIQSG